MTGPDAFDDRYAAGILDELPPEPGPRVAELVVAEPFALRGCVLTPEQRLDDGYVVVSGTVVESVGTAAPAAGTPVLETDGVVLPGLIDLHGHPEYNVFAAWEPPKLFANRYRWRASDEYRRVVREPWGLLTQEPSLLRDLTRYAEARALVGGATAIQGASAKYPDKDEALVRNVDLRIFGRHRARSIVDLGRAAPDDRARLAGQIAHGVVDAVYVHLAEGVPGDERSGKELADLAGSGLLTQATVIIHGTALTDEQLGDVKDAGAKLVWSPQSNLRLYGRTTHAAKALELGVPTGLGADWLPSGSQSLLAELKVARRQLTLQGTSLAQDALVRRLVAMATSEAAAIAGLGDRLGRLEAGRPADVLVLERHHDDPWENVVEAEPAWVQLMAIDGNLVYGRPDWLRRLAGESAELEEVVAWGKPMALDTTFSVRTTGGTPPRLTEIRGRLLARYPQAGPIFA